MADIDLIIDRNATDITRSRVRTSTVLQPIGFRSFVAGDNYNLSLQVVDSVGQLLNLTGYTIRVGIGSINSRPTGGVFTVGDGVDTAAGLAFDLSPAALQTALNALNTNTGPGGDTVTVEGIAGGPYRITWDTDGAQSILNLDATGLTPNGGGIVSRLVEGDGSTREVQLLRVYQNPFALQENFTIATTTATATFSTATAAIFGALMASASFASTFEVELTDPSGNISTILQAGIEVRGEVIPSGAGMDPTVSPYLTLAQAEQLFLQKVDAARVTMTGNITLLTTSAVYQFLDPDGTNRTVTLPASPGSLNLVYFIQHAGTANTITVQDGVGTLATLSEGGSVTVIYDGTQWRIVGESVDLGALATLSTVAQANTDFARSIGVSGITIGNTATDITIATLTLPTTGLWQISIIGQKVGADTPANDVTVTLTNLTLSGIRQTSAAGGATSADLTIIEIDKTPEAITAIANVTVANATIALVYPNDGDTGDTADFTASIVAHKLTAP